VRRNGKIQTARYNNIIYLIGQMWKTCIWMKSKETDSIIFIFLDKLENLISENDDQM
jgi:hypothetical protein